MASSKDRSKDEEIYIPHDFARSFQGWDDRFKQLQDNNEWLTQVDKRLSDSELSILRHAFLADGHNFISLLTEYLNAVKWQEFIVHIFTQRTTHIPILMHLIYEASYRLHVTDVQNSVGSEPTNPVFNDEIGNLKNSKLLHPGCIEAIRKRYCEPSLPVDGRLAFYIRRSDLKGRLNGAEGEILSDEINSLNQLHQIATQERDHFPGLTIETSTEADELIAEFEADMKQVDRTHVDNMTFGYADTVTITEPTFLSYSRRWNTIGKDLCDLGLGVGADVPRWPTQPEQWTIITALKGVINSEGTGIDVMLARL